MIARSVLLAAAAAHLVGKAGALLVSRLVGGIARSPFTSPRLRPRPCIHVQETFAEDVDAVSEEASNKIAELSSSRPVFTLNDNNFDRLVRSAHRPYHIFVLFNALDPQYQCQLCG